MPAREVRYGRIAVAAAARELKKKDSARTNDLPAGRPMGKLLTFLSVVLLNLFLTMGASVAQTGTKQSGWRSGVAPNGAVSATGFADDGFSSILFDCYKSATLNFVFDPRGYRGHALRKVLDLDQPFILEVRPASGQNQKFPVIAYMAGDGAWPTGRYGHERGLTGSAATAFLDAFAREGRLSLQTGNGVELASWTLNGMSKVRELIRNVCQL
jgi:hypothetical protein